MQGARRRPWWLPRASRATPQTPLALPSLRDRADFPSCGVVASLLGYYPTSSAPPCLRGNLPRSRPREILRQAPWAAVPRANPAVVRGGGRRLHHFPVQRGNQLAAPDHLQVFLETRETRLVLMTYGKQ